MEKKLKKGIFIVFDGPDGCGKSTQSKKVRDELISGGFEAVHTAEPGDTALGKKLRDTLLSDREITTCNIAELYLFEADRAQHVEEVIKPALSEGKIVICDRFNTSTFAYQGYGLGTDLGHIKTIDDIATGGLRPDLVVILDINVNTGLVRAGKVGPADKIEKRSSRFHERVRNGFLEIASKSPDQIKVVQVQDDIEDTYALVKEHVDREIKKYLKSC